MHKKVFVLVITNHPDEARSEADSFMDELIPHEFDYYQSITESGRWDEFQKWDEPHNAEDKATKAFIKGEIDKTVKEIKKWIKEGQKELEEKGFERDLRWTLGSFAIASGCTVANVFDGTGYGYGAMRSMEEYNQIVKYAKKEKQKLWMVGYDVHF